MYGVYDRQEHALLYCYIVTKTLGPDWLKDHRGHVWSKMTLRGQSLCHTLKRLIGLTIFA